MTSSRRRVLQVLGGLPLAVAATACGGPALAAGGQSTGRPVTLPDKANFTFEGVHLNAAYTHPVGIRTQEAGERYARARMEDGARNWPRQNARDEAVALFAGLINAQPTEIAVVPSTLEGENLVGAALGLGPKAGVVTDPFHYDASLVLYGEMAKRGMPLAVIAPRENRIDLADLDAAITRDTRLVAVSLVSSDTGYMHDLEAVCDVAHRRGALIYADIIQAVGAVPIDVKASGVDFCCAGVYKWLMGEFGIAFLYVRPDRLERLQRVQLGWRQIKSQTKHFMPFDPPGPVIGDWELGTDTVSHFEVSTPSWAALAVTVASLNYINDIGIGAMVQHRAPLLRRLQDELPKRGFIPLTPIDAQGPSAVFAYEGMSARFGKALKDAKIYTSVYKNKVRISPSVYSDDADIESLLKVIHA